MEPLESSVISVHDLIVAEEGNLSSVGPATDSSVPPDGRYASVAPGDAENLSRTRPGCPS
jgi:hypothetical protein